MAKQTKKPSRLILWLSLTEGNDQVLPHACLSDNEHPVSLMWKTYGLDELAELSALIAACEAQGIDVCPSPKYTAWVEATAND